jgi:hypothetical protein
MLDEKMERAYTKEMDDLALMNGSSMKILPALVVNPIPILPGLWSLRQNVEMYVGNICLFPIDSYGVAKHLKIT